MTLECLIHCIVSLFNLVVSWLGLRDSNNIDLEIVYKSNDFIIVNKPEDVFTNNHNKAVSKILLSTVYCYYNITKFVTDTLFSGGWWSENHREYYNSISEIQIWGQHFFLPCQFLLIEPYRTIEGNVSNYNYINGKISNNIKTDDQWPSLDILLGNKYPHLVNSNLEHGFYFVHRLDFVTSGVLCIALNKRACAKASGAMQKRISRKCYIALVRGHVSKDHLDLTDSIGYCAKEAEGNRKMCTMDKVCCTGPRDAHTRLVVLERGVFMSYPATKVLLLLITGRRHQIRVHCSKIGHTIVGDYTYSSRKDTSPSRTFLHSYRLELGIYGINVQTIDPFTEAKLNGLWIPVEYINRAGDDCFHLFDSYS